MGFLQSDVAPKCWRNALSGQDLSFSHCYLYLPMVRAEPHGADITRVRFTNFTAQRRSQMLTLEEESASLGSEASGMDHHTVGTWVRWIGALDVFWKRSIQPVVSNQSPAARLMVGGCVMVWAWIISSSVMQH
ncbi:hypothetical protein ATANTOWER_021110 [Ataeniobius toweri]|uniref:Uncharacterized protein n=1 Tax=Ataeniobius toweri TaxID=208326 RepID=A0ABU7B7X2_9TELE|nr:hypothetical protein [Ataeniobius toweri]